MELRKSNRILVSLDWRRSWCLRSNNTVNIAVNWGIWNQSRVLYSHLL